MNSHLSQYILNITAYVNFSQDFLLLKYLLCIEPLTTKVLSPDILSNHPPLNVAHIYFINIFPTIIWLTKTSWFQPGFGECEQKLDKMYLAQGVIKLSETVGHGYTKIEETLIA